MKAYEIDSDETITAYSVAHLASFEEGDWVRYGDSDGQVGVIVGEYEGKIDWPGGDDETVDPDGNVYVVARKSGGSKPFKSDELESVDRDSIIEGDVPDNPEKQLDEAEMSSTYEHVDDPHGCSVAELLSVPGVDDPGVGFDSWPDSWEKADVPARLIGLDAWSSMGGTWRGCFREIGSKRICSAFKDEILGTEAWRGWDD